MEKVVLLSLVVSFAVSAVLTKALIPMLRRLKMGQRILEIGPSWHVAKQGTPTMGGLAFIVAVLLVSLVYSFFYKWSVGLILVTVYAVMNGLIGITDDLLKIKRKQNEGLTASSKLFLQLLAATVFIILLFVNGLVSEELYIPFVRKTVSIGRLWYPFALLMLVGFTNAVNLTDGLDGLCSSVSGAVALTMALISMAFGEYAGSVVSFAVLGACLGFLIYNFYPAKIFMGDTGSLFLGAAISGVALISYKNTALLIIGGVYLLEALSVILQVLYYKATKKRLFLMAPYHHHLEKKGMSEVKITLVLTALTLSLGAASYLFI